MATSGGGSLGRNSVPGFTDKWFHLFSTRETLFLAETVPGRFVKETVSIDIKNLPFP